MPGEYLFGVSEEVFSRTVFFKQLTAPQIKDGVLAEQLQNVAVSSEEQLSSKKALDRLTKAKNELKGRAGNGKIPALERELAGLETALSDAWEERRELTAFREEEEKQQKLLDANKKRTAETGEELENLRRYDAALKLKNLRRLQAETEKAEADYLEAKVISGETSPVQVRRAMDALGRLDTAAEKVRRLETLSEEELPVSEAAPKAKASILPLVLGCVLLAAGAVLLAFLPIVPFAVMALGVVIQGATPHASYINSEVAKGLAQISLESGVPVTYGMITADNLEQAIERSGTKAGNKGADAAHAAIEMANLNRKLGK